MAIQDKHASVEAGAEACAGRARVLTASGAPGPLDYRLPEGVALPRGTIVSVPVGRVGYWGVVWGPATDEIPEARLKPVAHVPDLAPLPSALCDFVDWVARYTLTPPGQVLALALRVPAAFESERPRVLFRGSGVAPERLSPPRARVLALAQDGLARAIADWAELAATTPAVIRGLIAQGALEPVSVPETPPFPVPDPQRPGPSLTAAQEAAGSSLRAMVRAQAFEAALLDGVTGSGKTEVYLEAVAEALRCGRQALILLPEIALTSQLLGRIADRFGARPAEWHSDLNPRARKATWRAVHRGEAKIVVGARSALFLPFPRLGLVVVDEEHDTAFKQEEGAIYHARDMAVVRARLSGCAVVLASATPSLETWANAKAGRYRHLHLPERARDARPPAIALVDLRADPPPPGRFLSPVIERAVSETVAAGEQALLFLNRRGYAPLTLCRACGHRLRCPNCATWLVEHRYRRRLLCHHCGHEERLPEACPACHVEGKLVASGPGVERIAEEAAILWPQARIAVASSDMLHGPAEMQKALAAVAAGEVDILVGTQLVAKGHNFPNLTLVGVVDADVGLGGGDLRARERTFQLLMQVAGRAGRAERPGRALVQTSVPEDRLMQILATGDRDAFLAAEAEERRHFGLPPHGRLAALILSGADAEKVQEAGIALARAAPRAHGVEVLGPAPAPLAVIRGRTRIRLLVQAARDVDLPAYLRAWLAGQKLGSAVRLAVDIDPQSFL